MTGFQVYLNEEKDGKKPPNESSVDLPPVTNAENVVENSRYKIREEIRRPWSTFFNFKNLSMPKGDWWKRFKMNCEHFQSNYLFLFIGLFLFCLQTAPLMFIMYFITLGFAYLINRPNGKEPLVINGKEVSVSKQFGVIIICFIILAVLTLPVFAECWLFGASLLLMLTRPMDRAYLRSFGFLLTLYLLVTCLAIYQFLLIIIAAGYVAVTCLLIFLHATFYNLDAMDPSNNPSLFIISDGNVSESLKKPSVIEHI